MQTENNPETPPQCMDSDGHDENTDNTLFMTTYPQLGIVEGGLTNPKQIAQQLADHGFHWPVPAVWSSSQLRPQDLHMNLLTNMEKFCKDTNQVRQDDGIRRLCDVIGLIPLPTAFGPNHQSLRAVLVRIKHMALLNNGVQSPVAETKCFQNHHEIYLGRLGEHDILEWHCLPSLGILKLDLDKMSIVQVETNDDGAKRLIFTPLLDLLIAQCDLPAEKHTATGVNRLIGHDTTPIQPPVSGCLNIWHKPASPRKKDKRDHSPRRDSAKKAKKSKGSIEELRAKKTKAKDLWLERANDFKLAKRLKVEAKKKSHEAFLQYNNYKLQICQLHKE